MPLCDEYLQEVMFNGLPSFFKDAHASHTLYNAK